MFGGKIVLSLASKGCKCGLLSGYLDVGAHSRCVVFLCQALVLQDVSQEKCFIFKGLTSGEESLLTLVVSTESLRNFAVSVS